MNAVRLLASLTQPISRLNLTGAPAYAFAMAMVLLAAMVRALLPEGLGSRVPFPTFFIAVFISAWVGGIRAGLFASAATLMFGITVFPISPPPWDWRDAVALAFVFCACLFCAYVCARLRASTDRIGRDRDWHQRILDRVGDAVLVSDDAGRLRYFNRHAGSLWGIDANRLGEPLAVVVKLIHESNGEPYDGLAALLEGARPGVELPTGLAVPMGTRSIPVTGNVSAFTDPEYGSGAVLSVQSILALREAGRRTELSERRLRALFESEIVGVCRVDGDGAIVGANEHLLRLLGRTREAQAPPTRLEEIACPETVAWLRGQKSGGLAMAPRDLRLLGADGRETWVTMGSVPISPNERMVLAIDIGARRQAEQEVAETRNLLQILIDQVPAMVAFISRGGRIKLANRRFREAAGDAVAGADWWRCLDEKIVYAALAHMRRVLDGEPCSFMLKAANPGETPRDLQVHLVPHHAADQAHAGIVVYAYDVTEQLERERELAASEARFRRLAEASAAVVWQASADGRILAQFGWQEFAGDDAPGTIGDWLRAVHPDDADEISKLARHLREGKTGFEASFRLRYHDGTHRHVTSRAVILDEHPGGIGWIGTIRDVHQRCIAEEALAEKERELRLILDAVPARIAYLDTAGRFQWANRYFMEWYDIQYPAKGQFFERVMSKQAMAAMAGPLEHARSGLIGQVEWLEENHMMGRRWTTTTLSPDLDDNGDVRGIISLCMDSTQRHETEDALRRSDAEHRTLAENVPHLVWMSDAHGQLQYGNSRWTDYTGSNAGGHWTDAVHPDDLDGARSAMADAARRGGQLSLEVRIRRVADGAFRWHLVRALPLASPQGELVRWYGSCTDVDDQKAAQETLREAHTRMTGFLATLSHELRNPLAAMAASTPLLAHDQLGDDVRREAARTIDRQIRHLKRLTDDLLDVARITLGKIQINKELLDLRDVCRDCCADFSAKARGRGARLDCDLPDDPVLVEADPTRVRQCVDNLVSNAIKASSAGMHVVVKLRRRDGHVELVVSDEGVGIDPESLPSIFKAFSQSESWRNQGLGLGLNIVNRLVELHGGSISVESRGRNLGTRLTLRLPTPTGAGTLDAGKPEPSGPAADEHRLRGVVLIVDDERDNATALGHVLGLDGHEVHLAEDGIEAITRAESVRPDVVICDLGLPPPMHGHEVAGRLRVIFGNGIYLCAYSGYGSRADMKRSLDAGFDEHITKPASPRQIAMLVQRGLGARSAATADQGQPDT